MIKRLKCYIVKMLIIDIMIYLKELYLKMKKHYRSDNVLFCYKIVGTKKYIKNNTTTIKVTIVISDLGFSFFFLNLYKIKSDK